MAGIAGWVKENILDPIAKALKDGWDGAVGVFSITVDLVKKGWTTVTGWLGTAAETVISVGVSLAKKVGSWASEAWDAIKEGGKTITHNVQTALKKASTWVSEAWEALTTDPSIVTKTIQAAVKKASNWVADAWDALKTDPAIVTKTIQAAVKKTLTQAVKKGTWVNDAWTAVKTKAATVFRTLSQTVKKNTWVADAWTAAKKLGGTVSRTLKQAVTKGSWTDKAWTAAQKAAGTVKRYLEISVSWSGNMLSKAWKVIAGSTGGIVSTAGLRILPQFARGGIIRKGARGWLNSIPQFAGGGSIHGSLFLAGEAGPEIIGHVGGRTEILNKSQLASTMFQAVVAGMTSVANILVTNLGDSMIACANGIIKAIAVTAGMPTDIDYQGFDTSLFERLDKVADTIAFRMPGVSSGAILPYSVQAAQARDMQDIMSDSNEELATMLARAMASTAVGIINAIRENKNVTVNVDRAALADSMIDEINMRTTMYNRSPLKGY